MTSERNMHISTTTSDDMIRGAAETFGGIGFRPEDVGLQPDDPRLADDYYMDDDDDFRLPDDGGRSLEEIISDIGEREFAQYTPAPMTPEKLKAMAEKRLAAQRSTTAEEPADGERRHIIGKKRSGTGKGYNWKTGIAIAAALAIVFIIGLAIGGFTPDVGANNNKKEEIKMEDGVIIEDGGWGASEGEENFLIATKWEQVEHAKLMHPQLILPDYIPKGYEFEEMLVRWTETDAMTYEYRFVNANNKEIELEFFIQQDGAVSLDVNNIDRTVESMRGTIYIQEENNKIATICMDGGIMVKVWSSISDEEIIKIIDLLNS